MGDAYLDGKGREKFLAVILLMGAAFSAQVVATAGVLMSGMDMSTPWTSLLIELSSMVVVVCGMAAMARRSWLEPSRDDFSVTLHFGWWLMLVSLAVMVWDVSIYLQEGAALADDWPARALGCLAYCLSIGITEEFTYRGLLLGGLLALFGKTHRGVVVSVLVTSLCFGLAHVDFLSDLSSLLSVTQAVLKVLQTGVYSVVLCVIVLRSRHLWGASALHALDDFLILLPSMGLYADGFAVDYVIEGSAGHSVVALYLIIIALYLPSMIKALRELRRGQDVYRGPFMEVEVARAQAEAARVRQIEIARAQAEYARAQANVAVRVASNSYDVNQ